MDKVELSREELKKIADASLLAGKMMLESGAEVSIVEESVTHLAKTFGCEKVNLSVLPHTIFMTLVSGSEFRTKIMHIGPLSPNMQKLSQLYRIAKNTGQSDTPIEVLNQAESLISQKPQFNALQKIFAAAFACAAFAALFNAQAADFAAAFGAALLAAYIKNLLDKYEFNPFLSIFAAALIATVSAGIFALLGVIADARIVQASSVLFLVPGVQLINSFEDIIKGYYLNGLAKGLHGVLVSFGIVVGIAIGLKLLAGYA